MNIVYIGLGTNIEPRKKYLDDALEQLVKHASITIRERSSIYETEPVGYADQADFLNMVIEAETPLSSITLLDRLQEIERRLGRTREVRFGPRTIDLDILLYNQENSEIERLILPHPRMTERAFVLVPLEEIAPDLYIRSFGKTVREMLGELDQADLNGVRKLADF